MRKSDHERMRELERLLNHHSYQYHTLDNPEISDAEYDKLFRELLLLEERYPEWKSEDSPTNKVGNAPSETLKKSKHRKKMYSLGNVFSFSELKEFARKIKVAIPDAQESFWCDVKLDGLALKLVYINGTLQEAVTRGDGEVGEIVTPMAMALIGNLPYQLSNVPHEFEVCGEVVMSKANFETANAYRKTRNLKQFSNPRNAAAGLMRQINNSQDEYAKLEFFAYGLGHVSSERQQWSTYDELMSFLESCGFNIPFHGKVCNTPEEVEQYVDMIQGKKHDLPVNIDGVVIKHNSLDVQERLGYTERTPRFAVAFKFPDSQATTILRRIDLQIGRTGVLTPVAVFDPVILDGVAITKATLHNENWIRSKDIRIDDVILVSRSGDVIPKVIGSVLVNKRFRNKEFEFPTQCPFCGKKLVKLENAQGCKCLNTNCPGRQFRRITHFVSKSGLDVTGLGDTLISALIQNKIIGSPVDLFLLQPADLNVTLGLSKAMTDKILDKIMKAKIQATLPKFISGLGIDGVGMKIAKVLANQYRDIDSLRKTTIDELLKCEGVGYRAASSIVEFFNDKRNADMLDVCKEIGLWPTQDK